MQCDGVHSSAAAKKVARTYLETLRRRGQVTVETRQPRIEFQHLKYKQLIGGRQVARRLIGHRPGN